MSTFPDLLDDFIASRGSADPGPDDHANGDTFRTSEHTLFEVIHGEPHDVAGWDNPGTVDAMLWIANDFRGWARRALEDKLREARLVIMTVVPTNDFDDIGTDVMWWSLPVECMSCGEDLTDNQRPQGLCQGCIDLRGEITDLLPESARSGIQQQRGLHGSALPRSRPSDR